MREILATNMLERIVLAFIVYQVINFFYFPLSTTFPDEQRFLTEAIKFSETFEFWTGNSRAWEMPFTAIIYGLIYKLFYNIDHTIIVIRLMQSIMVIFQAILIYRISQIVFKNDEVAFLSFNLMLFYPFFIFYQGLLLSETLFITLFLSGFYFLYRWYENDLLLDRYLVLASVTLTFSLYVKGTLSIFPPVLITLFYFLNKFSLKKAILVFIVSILVYIILMSSWWIRNYYIFDKFVPFTTSSGMNLYLGANEYNKYGDISWATSVEQEFVLETNNIKDEIERNNTYKEKAISFITNNPLQYLKLMWLKFQRYYSFTFNSKKFDNLFYNLISMLSYGVVITFALLFFILNLSMWKKFSAIYLVIGYFTLIHIVFIASIRYRLPLEPLFILMASYSMVHLKNKILSRKNE